MVPLERMGGWMGGERVGGWMGAEWMCGGMGGRVIGPQVAH